MSSCARPVPAQRNSRAPALKAEHSRALKLLAASPEGCTEALLIAHGFTVGVMVDLARAGLASAHASAEAVARYCRWKGLVRNTAGSEWPSRSPNQQRDAHSEEWT
jgi:hypothetical protein